MHRDTWEALRTHTGELVEVDVSEMPIASLTSGTTLDAAVAERRSGYEVVLSIYRRDPADEPTPVNVDKYVVWERLPDHRDYMDMVNRAATSDNANMRGFLGACAVDCW